MSLNRRKSETLADQGFHHTLGVLDKINSWAVWHGAVTLLLLSGVILLLCFPSSAFLGDSATKLVVIGLLGLWLATAFTLNRQRSSLAVVRKALIEQMDAATKHSARAERFYGLSISDPLTGLYNRRFGETRLEEEIAKTETSGDPLVVLAMDFDRFKQINDTLGHAAGDLALKEFSRRLQRAVRACDLPIRVGGDEFLVILPDCPLHNVQTIISRMHSIEFAFNGKRVPLSFSYGMAQYQVNDTPEAIIKRADHRLYDVKAEKKKAAARAVESKAAPETPGRVQPRADRCQYLPPPADKRREPIRQSVRLPIETPVFLIGSDLHGKGFSEETVALNVSPHGAAILSCQKLTAEQEIIVRCLDTNQDAEARVVRTMELPTGDFAYGLAFVVPEANIWGVKFPPLLDAEERAGSLFACTRCNSREELDPADAACGNASEKTIVRSCKRCGSETAWFAIGSGGPAGVTDEAERAPAFAREKAV